jgi:hypothetical protein
VVFTRTSRPIISAPYDAEELLKIFAPQADFQIQIFLSFRLPSLTSLRNRSRQAPSTNPEAGIVRE